MRIVIYDDEDMEPITVVNLRGMTERDIYAMDMRLSIAAPPPPPDSSREPVEFVEMRVVDVTFERPIRRGQVHLMAFAKAADLAMLLKPDWLPGQRPTIEALWRENDKLTDLFMAAMGVRLAGH